jgi:hypothetical protein
MVNTQHLIDIEWRYGKMEQFKPQKDHCPVCNTKWTVSGFGAKIWYDCGPCGKTAEEITKNENNDSTLFDSESDSYDLGNFEDWERLLDDANSGDVKFKWIEPFEPIKFNRDKHTDVSAFEYHTKRLTREAIEIMTDSLINGCFDEE